jgi:hypothetical protein
MVQTVHDFTRGDRVHIEGWGSAEFIVVGHIWRRGLVSVEVPEGGISGDEPPERLIKIAGPAGRVNAS